jgi:serine/threonine-protein kinase SRPK3
MFKVVRFLFGHKPWTPFRVLNSGFEVIKNDVLLEKEHLEDFRKGVYYPINIGDVFASSYQVVGKLGFGTTSTVWLARDMQYAQISYPANIWNVGAIPKLS